MSTTYGFGGMSRKSLSLLVIQTGPAIIGLKFKSCGCVTEMYSVLVLWISLLFSYSYVLLVDHIADWFCN